MSEHTEDFFESQTERSRIKARIVATYVQTWARILSGYLRQLNRPTEVAYIDLFSGPGVYLDGTPSTPLLILKQATEDDRIRSSLHTFFNDSDPKNVETLKDAIDELPGREALSFRPIHSCERASIELVKSLCLPPNMPKLYFLDQFGYSRVTLRMIEYLMSDWAECILFFNYRRAIGAFDNPVLQPLMIKLFGTQGNVDALRSLLSQTESATERERIVLTHLMSTFRRAGVQYFQPFAFKVERDHRSMHHLIFLTNHPKGYGLMKGIMARNGTEGQDGLPYLSYIERTPELQTADLFPVDRTRELSDSLERMFGGQQLSIQQIFERHSRGNALLPNDYKHAIRLLEQENRISANPPESKRPLSLGVRSMPLSTVIAFKGGRT